MKSLVWKKNRLIAIITLFVMIMAPRGAVEVLAGLATPSPSPPPPADHLICYKVKDLAVHPTVQNLGVDLTTTQFGELSCKIVGNYREFCVPTSKEIVDDGLDPPPGPSPSPSPLVDRICYEVRGCTGDVPPPTVNVRDQLGQRDITFLSGSGRQKTPPAPYTLCTPAEKCNSDCIEYGGGSECDLEGGMDSEEGVCEDLCRCVRCGESGQLCCSSDTCDYDLTCDNGTCSNCGDLGEDCCSGDKKCNSNDLACDENECVECGGDGDPCCAGDGPECTSDDLICDAGSCEPCGHMSDEHCCPDDTCVSPSNVCINDSCVTCGQDGDPCCKDHMCHEDDLVCNSNNECEHCGLTGEACCTQGQECQDENAECIADECTVPPS